MAADYRKQLREIRDFRSLIPFLRDEMNWPISQDALEDVDDLFFDYTPEEIGVDAKNAAKIQSIKQLRPLNAGQPWGVFFVRFEPRRLPVVALRRILSQVAVRRRASANRDDRAAWKAGDLLFVSAYGEGDDRQIGFAHFTVPDDGRDLPVLKVLGWDNRDAPLRLDDVATELTTHLAWPEQEGDADAWRRQWRSAFTLRHGEVVATSKDLSIRLAELARAIRDRTLSALAIETQRGPLTKLLKAFQESLIHDLDDDGFADMYAQTIAYGLLSARIADPARKTVDDFAAHMRTSPFLRELMETFVQVGGRRGKTGGPGIDFDELGVSDVVDLLDHANMEAVVRDFGDRNPLEDPVIHFYERFLSEYNKQLKIQRGVFYTPQPVVSYIVRSVHELLQTGFGLVDGLADTSTWGEMLERHPDLKLPPLTDEPGDKRTISPDEPFVQILDPATGTATFVVEVIDVIHRTLVARWKKERLTDAQQNAAWNEYVPEHLLPRLHAFELMMAPYAIAHMKVGLKLAETGYRFGSDERARIYLTNALEPWIRQLPMIGFDALAHEADAVNEIKRRKRFTVVIGNPPYSAASHNPSVDADGHLTAIGTLMRRYFEIEGVSLGERNPRWLQDDYVKFLRFAESKIERSAIGVVGMITNHGYLANPTFRGMRYSLLRTFTNATLLDLHGNSKRGEVSPDGTADDNVFDIQQGVAISVWSRRMVEASDKPVARVERADLWGTRQSKYGDLAARTAGTIGPRLLHPVAPFFLFIDQDVDIRREYDAFWSLRQIFPVNSTGVITKRDALTIGWTRDDVWRTVSRFVTLGPLEARDEFDLPADVRDWKVEWAQKDLRTTGLDRNRIQPIAYRPFDTRFIYYTGNARGFVGWPVEKVMRHLLAGNNYGLISARSNKSEQMDHFFVTRNIMETKCGERTTQSCVFPLFLVMERSLTQSGEGRAPNIQSRFGRALGERIGAEYRPSSHRVGDGFGAEDILFYSYAVFFSPSYRERYAECLKIDFPHLPLPGSLGLFRELGGIGSELVALHVLESPRLTQPIAEFVGSRSPEVEKLSWSRNTVWIDKEQATGFKGVREDVWNFHVGGYQVCEKWLKDRKGRTLSKDDIAHYQKVVVALSETIRLMDVIDEVIEAHGGWPGAFVTEPIEEQGEPVAEGDLFGLSSGAEDGEGASEQFSLNDAFSSDGEGEDEGEEIARVSIDEIDRTELLCLIRELLARPGQTDGFDRDDLLRDLARQLGFKKVGSRIRDVLNGVLIAGARRGILETVDGRVALVARSIGDLNREFLKEQFLASLKGTAWWEREAAIRDFARWFGFRRTGSAIEENARSLINGLIRTGHLEARGSEIRKAVQ